MTGEPPSLTGGVNVTLALALAVVAVPMVGAPGMPRFGVTLFDAADTGPLPMALIALTTQVTALPFGRPVTVIGELLALLL